VGEAIPHRRGIRIVRLAPGAGDAVAWRNAIASYTPQSELKADGASRVWRAEMLGQAVIVKHISHPTLWGRAKILIGASRAARQWRGAEKLARAGIPAASPLALARDSDALSEWLVLKFVPGRTLIDTLDHPPPSVKAQHALAAAVGAQVGAIVNAGVYNRDHKPSNLIVPSGDGPVNITVLDTVAIRRCPPGSIRRAAQMLASLHIEPTGLKCAARRALRARSVIEASRTIIAKTGVATRRSTIRAVVRLLWEAASEAVASHGEPRPRVDPRAG